MERFEDVGADGRFDDGITEVLCYFIVNISFEQGSADIFHGVFDVGAADASPA